MVKENWEFQLELFYRQIHRWGIYNNYGQTDENLDVIEKCCTYQLSKFEIYLATIRSLNVNNTPI